MKDNSLPVATNGVLNDQLVQLWFDEKKPVYSPALHELWSIAQGIRIGLNMESRISEGELISFLLQTIVCCFEKFDPARAGTPDKLITNVFRRYFRNKLKWMIINAYPHLQGRRLNVRWYCIEGLDFKDDSMPVRDAIALEEDKSWVRMEVSKLPEYDRYIIDKRYWHDNSFTEIGNQLKKDSSTIRRKHNAITNKLANRYAEMCVNVV